MTNYKPTKLQFENECYKTQIIALLQRNSELMTASEVAYNIGITTQKAAALLNSLTFGQEVTATYCEHKKYYSYGQNPSTTICEKTIPTYVFTTPKPKAQKEEEPISLMRKIINYFNPPLD